MKIAIDDLAFQNIKALEYFIFETLLMGLEQAEGH
jgi:hypothetical protein